MKIHAIITTVLAISTCVLAVGFYLARENQTSLVQDNIELTKELTIHERAGADTRSFLNWYNLNEMEKPTADKMSLDSNIQILRSNYIHHYPNVSQWIAEESDIAWNEKSK